jgi:uridine kinase
MFELLVPDSVCLLPMDAYYKDHGYLTAEEKKYHNFDHPEAFDFDLIKEHLQLLKLFSPVHRPVYSFIDCCRLQSTVEISPREIILVDGLLAFCDEDLQKEFDLCIYLDVKEDIRLQRVVKRDVSERGREPEAVIERFYRQVKPMHDEFIEPVKQYADLIIDGNDALPEDIALQTMEYVFNYMNDHGLQMAAPSDFPLHL